MAVLKALQSVRHSSDCTPPQDPASDGLLFMFVVPPPLQGQSSALYDAADAAAGGSSYLMLQESLPVQRLAEVLNIASTILAPMVDSLRHASLQQAAPEVLSMLKKCLGHICITSPCVAPVLKLYKEYKGTSAQHQASNILLGSDLSSSIRPLELRHLVEPLFSSFPLRVCTLVSLNATHP
eukprot:jgi/Ulvmu1/4084/UM019_0063.1